MSDPRIIPVGGELPPLDAPPPARRDRARRTPPDARARADGRFQMFNAFIDVTMRELTRAETDVWLILFRDTKPTGLARTGQADMAVRAGMSVRAVGAAIHSLERRGLLDVVRRGGLQKGPSTYRVRAVPAGAPPSGSQLPVA